MGISVQRNNDYTYLLELSGSMDLVSSEELKKTFMLMIKNRIECFIISLEEVRSISSAGIGALIYISSTLKKLNFPMVIIASEGPAMKALEITKLKSYFNIVPSMQEALSQTWPERKAASESVKGLP